MEKKEFLNESTRQNNLVSSPSRDCRKEQTQPQGEANTQHISLKAKLDMISRKYDLQIIRNDNHFEKGEEMIERPEATFLQWRLFVHILKFRMLEMLP